MPVPAAIGSRRRLGSTRERWAAPASLPPVPRVTRRAQCVAAPIGRSLEQAAFPAVTRGRRLRGKAPSMGGSSRDRHRECRSDRHRVPLRLRPGLRPRRRRHPAGGARRPGRQRRRHHRAGPYPGRGRRLPGRLPRAVPDRLRHRRPPAVRCPAVRRARRHRDPARRQRRPPDRPRRRRPPAPGRPPLQLRPGHPGRAGARCRPQVLPAHLPGVLREAALRPRRRPARRGGEHRAARRARRFRRR